jgi:hypothetical protein
MGFKANRFPTIKKGEQAKIKGERLRIILFEQWVIDHPIIP